MAQNFIRPQAPESPGNLPTAQSPQQFDSVPQVAGGVPSFLPYEPYGENEEEKGIDFKRYLSALLAWKWMIAAVTIAGSAGGVLLSRSASMEYRATATILIASSGGQNNAGDPRPIQQSQLLQAEAWVELLRTAMVLDTVVFNEKLYLDVPTTAVHLFENFSVADRFWAGRYRVAVEGNSFALWDTENNLIDRAEPGDSLGEEIGFKWVLGREAFRPGLNAEFGVRVPREVANGLRDNLNAPLARNGVFLPVELTDTDPSRAAATLNAILNRFVEVAHVQKTLQLVEATAVLQEQLAISRSNLAEAEQSLKRFRVQTITLPAERGVAVTPGLESTRDPAFENFFQNRTRREILRTDRAALERVLSQIPDSGVSIIGFEMIGAVQLSSELKTLLDELSAERVKLRALKQTYTDEHPDVVDLVTAIRELEYQEIPSFGASILDELRGQERQLDGLIAASSDELQEIPERETEERRLERQQEIAETLYTSLESRYSEALLAEKSSFADIRVFDQAEIPENPIRDQRIRIMLLGFVGSLTMAIVAALVLDRFDRRVRYPEQVADELGLRILGAIPRAATGKGVEAGQAHQVIESIRAVRLNVQHGYGGVGPLTLTVTSAGGGDGKSFVSANLALSFAEAGYSTLLVDGDIRRGQLHRLFEANRKPGLSEALRNKTPFDGTIQQTSFSGLDLMGCGTRTQSAPELLGSTEMAELLGVARTRYSVVIVDSPPMGAGIDSMALGSLTGNVMLVVRTGTTDKVLMQSKLEMLQRLPIRILGAVMNDVKAGRMNGYYGYYAYYLPGYEAADEVDDVESETEVVSRVVRT